jgi:hypothetical protein
MALETVRADYASVFSGTLSRGEVLEDVKPPDRVLCAREMTAGSAELPDGATLLLRLPSDSPIVIRSTSRIDKLKREPAALQYFTGFPGGAGCALVRQCRRVVVASSRCHAGHVGGWYWCSPRRRVRARRSGTCALSFGNLGAVPNSRLRISSA